MAKVNKNLLLQRAEGEFLSGEFGSALRDYAILLKDYPTLDEAKVGAYLSDLGIESSEEAQALFDYYQAIKDEKENAAEIIDSLIRTLDHSKDALKKLFVDPIEEQVEYSDGVRYSTFLELVELRGSFKRAFEDIMFSTKIIITNKEEFIDFVKKLTAEGFNETALNYLDASSALFGNDQEVLVLYNLVVERNQ